MALFLREAEVQQLLTMPLALQAVEEAFLMLGRGEAIDIPRERTRLPKVAQHILQGALPSHQIIGYKHYTSSRAGIRFLVYLYHAEQGHLEAILEANNLGMMRTGAASGVATRHLARKDATRLMLFGSGSQAEGQLRAIAAVRSLQEVKVFARQAEKLHAFCERMQTELKLPVIAADSATLEQAVREAHIITTITTSATPLFNGEWLAPGTHINAAGSNSLIRQELDETAVRKSDRIVVDTLATALREAGDLLPSLEKGRLHTRQLIELGHIVSGKTIGRSHDQAITLFESQGLAVQDLLLAKRLTELAKQNGLGSSIPLGA